PNAGPTSRPIGPTLAPSGSGSASTVAPTPATSTRVTSTLAWAPCASECSPGRPARPRPPTTPSWPLSSACVVSPAAGTSIAPGTPSPPTIARRSPSAAVGRCDGRATVGDAARTGRVDSYVSNCVGFTHEHEPRPDYLRLRHRGRPGGRLRRHPGPRPRAAGGRLRQRDRPHGPHHEVGPLLEGSLGRGPRGRRRGHRRARCRAPPRGLHRGGAPRAGRRERPGDDPPRVRPRPRRRPG